MADREHDDWMHPRPMPCYVHKERDPKETPWLIVREKRVICSFSGGRAPTEWLVWSEFATETERDAELDKLRETTSWSLRSARRDFLGDGWDFDDHGPSYALKFMHRMNQRKKASPA